MTLTFSLPQNVVFMNSCGVSPVPIAAAVAMNDCTLSQEDCGLLGSKKFLVIHQELKNALATLLQTNPDDISITGNTALGMSLIAQGLQIRPGDEIITYEHEYPSNFYPWLLQENRGATVKQIPDRRGLTRPTGIDVEALLSAITRKTRVVALSHVQFTSGYTIPLEQIGRKCREYGALFVVDAAQSLGAFPIYPEAMKIDAIVAPSSKWLVGPLGLGVMYTSSRLRSHLDAVAAGPYMMRQTIDYLDHTWNPFLDGRFFEFSTLPLTPMEGLRVALRDGVLQLGIEKVWHRIQDIQAELHSYIRHLDFSRPELKDSETSTICSFITKQPPEELMEDFRKQGVLISTRGGYLRFAPHFFLSDADVSRALAASQGVLR